MAEQIAETILVFVNVAILMLARWIFGFEFAVLFGISQLAIIGGALRKEIKDKKNG